MQLVRLLSLAAAFVLMLAGGAAFAHEDHEDLGAGPGPSEEQVEAQGGSRKAAVSAHEGMAEAHEMATEEHEQAADENKTFSERLVSWLGRLHTLAIHFPIAMFVGALGVELVGLWRRDPSLRTAVHVTLAVGAIGAVGAAALGWFAGGFYPRPPHPVLPYGVRAPGGSTGSNDAGGADRIVAKPLVPTPARNGKPSDNGGDAASCEAQPARLAASKLDNAAEKIFRSVILPELPCFAAA
ncbi:hypothetical protein GRI40_13205 [Altererythrobacter aerius]|uniref:DUF2231 domain-containing protein n=1 Tax=Tsuneonella aeria TaxID=1837929 RepID=A0A6I4TJF2_9SPHN|nr:DUF2231 domain-containing protein [Tsuneonella aeria]MXO76170.1 hypothetical protein [Tsuneonella aeria]